MSDYIEVLQGKEAWSLVQADSADFLPTMPDNSVDSVVCDPPYALTDKGGKRGFMGKTWDVPDVAFDPVFWREVARVLRPGGHVVAFGGDRTYHRLACAIEDSGMSIRGMLCWHFASGFPKNHSVSKAIDRMAGAEREVVGSKIGLPGYSLNPNKGHGVAMSGNVDGSLRNAQAECAITAPATPAAQQWDGWGTALRPSVEPICLARKPLAMGTVAAQVLATGTGAINIDACRVSGVGNLTFERDAGGRSRELYRTGTVVGAAIPSSTGRWPANVLFCHAPGCRPVGTRTVRGDKRAADAKRMKGTRGSGFADVGADSGDASPNGALHGDEQVQAWACVDGCPVAELGRQSGVSNTPRTVTRGAGGQHGAYSPIGAQKDVPSYGDEGTASRFFPTFAYEADDFVPFLYTTKASKADRSDGLDGDRNTHVTVKPLSICHWLIKLVTQPGGVVLDPFAGSGSTGLAATRHGFRFIGIERDEGHAQLARKRIGGAWGPLFREADDDAS